MGGRNNHAPTKSRSNNNQQQQQCDSGSRHAIPEPVQHPTSGLPCTATSFRCDAYRSSSSLTSLSACVQVPFIALNGLLVVQNSSTSFSESHLRKSHDFSPTCPTILA
jgi:hypothetical protein